MSETNMSSSESRKRKLESVDGAASEAADSAGDARRGDPDTVTFDVQGESFKVLTSTIRRHPETLLCTLLDTEADLSKPIFVEGDKALFPYILAWYRHASSKRIKIPITVSKPALEQECRTFALPDDVLIERESVVDMMPGIASALQEELQQMKGAEKKQALALQKKQFDSQCEAAFKKAVEVEIAELKGNAEKLSLAAQTKLKDESYEQAVIAAAEQRAKVGIEYLGRILSAALLQGVEAKGTMESEKLFQANPHCFVIIALPQCSACQWQSLQIQTVCKAVERYLDEERKQDIAKALAHIQTSAKVNLADVQGFLVAPSGLRLRSVISKVVTDCASCSQRAVQVLGTSRGAKYAALLDNGFIQCEHERLTVLLELSDSD